MMIIKSNMVTNKNVWKYKNPGCLTFLLTEFIDTVLTTFVGIVLATFVDTLSAKFIILLHTITELLTILFKCSLYSQIHVLGFQL